MGRFITQGPLAGSPAVPLSLNRFSYAEDGPATRRDPSGLAVETPRDPVPGNTAGANVVLRDAKAPAASPEDKVDHQSCSGGLLTFCGLWARGPGGILIPGILWDPCWSHPWTCDKDEGGGGGGLSSSDIAWRIANGHAFEEHVVQGHEFTAITAVEDLEEQKQAFADLIEYTIENGEEVKLSGGRTKYFDEETETIVVVNPGVSDYGTAYYGDRAAFLRAK